MELPSLFLLSSFLLLLLFILVEKRKRSKTQSINSKLPPGPWKLPFIGSSHHMLGLPHHTLRNLAKKYGPLMHLQLGEISTIIISSSKMAKEVSKTHDLKFVNRFVVYAPKVITYECNDMAFATYGDYWRQMRKICMIELLSAKRIQSFQSVREEEVSNLIESISSLNGSTVNISKMIFSSMNDIISRSAFGNKCKDKLAFISLIREASRIGGGFSVADLFPSLKFLLIITGMKPKLEKIHWKIDRMLEDIIIEHKEYRRTIEEKDNYQEDLLDVLLRLQEDAKLDLPITTMNVKAVILDVFIAGSDTQSTVLEWAMSEMLKNPRVMEKAQAEVRQVLKGKAKIKEADIHELSYLKLVIKEALRLHPPLPFLLPRECLERCEMDGYEIPVNTKLIINAWALGRDPEHWTDPEKFIPERFDGTAIDYKGNNFEYIPFGAGRRICPGILFASTNIELALAQLLYHFDWKLPNGMKPEELDMTEAFGSSIRRKNNLHVSAIPYSP